MDADKEVQPKLVHLVRRPEELSCLVTVTRNHNQVKVEVELPPDDTSPEYSLEIYVGGRRKGGSNGRQDKGKAQLSNISKGGNTQVKPVSTKGGQSRLDDSEIGNSYKGGNTHLDPVSPLSGRQRCTDSDISNSYKAGNTQLDPVPAQSELSGLNDANRDKGGNSVLDPVTAVDEKDGDLGRLINALNYLLTSDKELHDESSNVTKQVNNSVCLTAGHLSSLHTQAIF